MADRTPATNTQACAVRIARIDQSGIPQATAQSSPNDEVVAEFASNLQAMAAAIIQLRAALALARTPAVLIDRIPTKHTPGGWSRNIPPARKYSIIFAGRNTHVCSLSIKGLSDEEIEANANLIAAAPDLLEALQTAAHLLRTVGFTIEGTITQAINRAILRACGGVR